MAKASSKNSVIFIGGYVLSSYASEYSVSNDAGKMDVTGFGDGCINFIPGLPSGQITADMFWSYSATNVHEVLRTLGTTGHVTVVPEGYSLGVSSLSMPVTQSDYKPRGAPAEPIKAGVITFDGSGSGVGIEYGVMLAYGTTTVTATGDGVLDVTDAAATATCGATLHIYAACAADTYVVKVQHSSDNVTYADLLTFSANGSIITSERQTAASGAINKYRRVIATRTGSAGNTFGYAVHFWRGAQ